MTSIVRGSLSGKITSAGKPTTWRTESAEGLNRYRIIGPDADFIMDGRNLHFVGNKLIDIIDDNYVKIYQMEPPVPRPISVDVCKKMAPAKNSILIYYNAVAKIIYHAISNEIFTYTPVSDFTSVQLLDGWIIGRARSDNIVGEFGTTIKELPAKVPDRFFVTGKYIVCSYQDRFIVYDHNWVVHMDKQCYSYDISKESQNVQISVLDNNYEQISIIIVNDYIYDFDTTELKDIDQVVFQNGYVAPGIVVTYRGY